MQHKQFVYAGGKLIALNTQVKDSAHKLVNKQVRYLHYDALDSVDMITDGFGSVVEQRSFDPWGKMRSVIWEDDRVTNIAQQLITNRGFTGHEHIEEVGFIHMNGRVYDQELGRFLSADPLIQAPFVTNSFNRYSYVMNNPLKYTDPTGFSTKDKNECSADSASLTGRESSNSGNGCDNTPRDKVTHRGSEGTVEKIDAKEFAELKSTNGKFTLNDDNITGGYYDSEGDYHPAIMDGDCEKIWSVANVQQVLDVNQELVNPKLANSVEVSSLDTMSIVAETAATFTLGRVGQTLVSTLTTLVKAQQKVEVDIVQSRTTTYDTYKTRCKYIEENASTYGQGEPKFNRQVSFKTEVNRVRKSMNIRDISASFADEMNKSNGILKL